MPSFGLIVCEHCGVPRPVSEFRWRQVGVSRHSDCRFCHSRSESKRVTFQRKARRDNRIGRVCRAIAQADDLLDVRRLARNLMDVFGGPRQLARSLADVIDSAKPGSMISANVLSAVLKIHLLVETNPVRLKCRQHSNPSERHWLASSAISCCNKSTSGRKSWPT